MTKDPRLDKILGLHEPISRRHFLDGTLKASTGMLAAGACHFSLGAQASTETNSAWAGYTGEGDYKQSAGNTGQVMQNAHAVRDGKYDKPPTDVAETGEAVWIWRLKMNGSLGGEETMTVNNEFVALGDAAKDVRIVENQAIAI